MDYAEDRGIGANAERQREHGHGGKSGALSEHSRGITQILQNVLDEIHASHIPALLLNLRETANRPERGVAGFFRAQACRKVLGHLLFQVEAQLFFQLHVDLWPAAQRAPSQPQFIRPAHAVTPRSSVRPD